MAEQRGAKAARVSQAFEALVAELEEDGGLGERPKPAARASASQAQPAASQPASSSQAPPAASPDAADADALLVPSQHIRDHRIHNRHHFV